MCSSSSQSQLRQLSRPRQLCYSRD